MSDVFDDRHCALGEGSLWHPERGQLFWFDILEKRLLTRDGDLQQHWQFDEYVSAAGWIDANRLLIASETQLFVFDLANSTSKNVCDLESDNTITRSNDGRADPYGGFWIGTMGRNVEAGAGSIYRFYKGELKTLFTEITISNAICFTPDGKHAYFADTVDRCIQKVGLDCDGWPIGSAEIFVDLGSEHLSPDGAVVDADGYLWNAQWGSNRVARYAPDGTFVEAITFAAKQTSCPAFGGKDLKTLYATSAAHGLTGDGEGLTYCTPTKSRGQKEHRVIL